MPRRRGQLQTLEPVLIAITLTVLLLVGGAYFLRVTTAAAEDRASVARAAEDLALLERVATLPELRCASFTTSGRLCIDREKAVQFGALVGDDERRTIEYFPLFGASDVTLRIIDLSGTAQEPVREILLYQGLRNVSDVRATRTYATLIDPASGDVALGMIEIRRGVGSS